MLGIESLFISGSSAGARLFSGAPGTDFMCLPDEILDIRISAAV